jgi:ABC-type dipeptide/oligopeptide/nickel transport system ATPase component
VILARPPSLAHDGDVVLSVDRIAIEHEPTASRIVSSVSLSLRKGRSIGMVGESGSGKTLTCRAILGLLPAPMRLSGGSIAIQGRNTASFSRKDWERVRGPVISAVFQDPGSFLNPVMRVGRQVEEIVRVRRGMKRREARAKVLALFDAVRLRDPEQVFHRYPQELSGGMVQRVLLAAAIALDPAILIADEATTALDVTVQAEILDLLASLQRTTDLSLLVVSHDLAVVAQLCDEVLVMKSGEVVEAGPAAEVLHRPRDAYTQSLVREHLRYGLEHYLAQTSAPKLPHAS